jgi:tetratricopeptide (TPR) repeat protein
MTVPKARRLPPAAMSILCGALLSFPAAAQQPAAAIHSVPLSREERQAMIALEAAARGSDRAAQDAALAAARAVARGDGARHALAHYQLEIARARQDVPMTSQAVDALVSSNVATAEELPSLYANQALRAVLASEYPRAERLLERAIEQNPNDAQLTADLAQIKTLLGGALRQGGRQAEAVNQYRAAAGLFARAIELRRAAGQPAPESWYKRATAISFDNSFGPQAVAFARGLVSTYPSVVNWRDALNVFRVANPADPTLDLDIRRLQRATEALAGERDYLDYAQAAERAELGGEAKAVIDEGVTRGMLSASEPVVRQLTTAVNRRATTQRGGLARQRTSALAAATGGAARAAGDLHFGFGQYGEAAELYQAALQKGGEDANLVNTRLGAALALAGRRAEAAAALRAVTGPRADLAGFWLAWLARRPS